MSDKNVDSLNVLFADKSMFIHMGGTWGKTQELTTIKSGGICCGLNCSRGRLLSVGQLHTSYKKAQ